MSESESKSDANQQLMNMEQLEQMFQLFQKMQKLNTANEQSTSDLRVTEKLNYQNYSKWCRLMKIALEGRGRLKHIIDTPPSSTDANYLKWKQQDSMVLSWIISNIESELINQFLDYTTAYDLWNGITILLASGHDELQIFDLSSKASSVKQNQGSIEEYYGCLDTLWKEIDRRMPNPMKCAEDITIFNTFIQKQRLFQFLAGINDTFDKERRDLLNQDPLPSVEAAYAAIRRKINRRGIMTHASSLGPGPSEIGSGLVARNRSGRPSYRQEEDKSHLKCSHCGGTRHTKEGCFKLIGFPEW